MKFAIGLFLLAPAGVLASCAAVQVVAKAWEAGVDGLAPAAAYFAFGCLVWVTAFFALPRPYVVYVFGHEFTHAIWAWLSGGRVTAFEVTAQGGMIRTDRPNFLVVLAPYFFPVYSLLFLWVWLLAGFWVPLDEHIHILYALVGLGWGFHLTFTCTALHTAQSDITSQGWIFSLSFIYLMNLVPFSLFLIAVTPGIGVADWWHEVVGAAAEAARHGSALADFLTKKWGVL